MGVVYLAEDHDGTPVAIKLIHPALAADPEFSGRFRSEVLRARQVPAFCTAEFLDADLDSEPPYLVTEYVDGPSLGEVVEAQGPLRGGALHSLAAGLATALTGIHGAGVIHRDLKPDNVLLPPGSPKVIDFGIARPFEATSQHTSTDVMVGTIPYMAPERLADEPPDVPLTAATDVFAWGCVVTYAGTGRTPFRGDSPTSTVAKILTGPPRLDGLPDPLRAVVALALAKDPAARPAAPELLAMLIGERPLPAAVAGAPPVPVPATRRRTLALLSLVVLLAGAAAAALVLPGTAGKPTAERRSAPAVPVKSTATASAQAPPVVLATRPSTASLARPTRASHAAVPHANANPSGRNLALGRPATASGVEGAAWTPDQAVDGDGESRWASAWSDPQWIRIDLGASYQISRIVLHWEHAYAVSYRVEVSTDGAHWTTLYRTSSGAGGDVAVAAGKVPGRFVRMYGIKRSGQYGYSIYEIEVR